MATTDTCRPGTRRLALCALLSLTALAWLPSALAAGWTLDDLMQALAVHRTGHASFTETKTLAILDKPLESSGELRFSAPDYLEMRTLKPRPQTLILRADRLSVELDGRSRTVQLAEHPDIAVLVNSIRATLNGDRDALRRDYTVTFDGDAGQWHLLLVPLQPGARKRVREIRIDGSQDRILTIAVQQTDGDHSLMTIHELPSP